MTVCGDISQPFRGASSAFLGCDQKRNTDVCNSAGQVSCFENIGLFVQFYNDLSGNQAGFIVVAWIVPGGRGDSRDAAAWVGRLRQPGCTGVVRLRKDKEDMKTVFLLTATNVAIMLVLGSASLLE